MASTQPDSSGAGDPAPSGSTPTKIEANKAVVAEFWEALGRRDFDAVGRFMAEDGHYIDVPLVDDGDNKAPMAENLAGAEAGAEGPEEVAARLRLGIEPLENYVLHDGRMIAEGDTVVTEHSEEWFWHTGEHIHIRFCSVQEIRDGKIARWWDYVDLAQLLNAAPQWWLDHIMEGYK